MDAFTITFLGCILLTLDTFISAYIFDQNVYKIVLKSVDKGINL